MLTPDITPAERRFAILMLVVSTVFWGMGFAWAKNTGEAANLSAQMPVGSTLGPVLVLSIRFLIGGAVWWLIFPRARKGWSAKTFICGLLIGVPLCSALILQHLGLDRTTEAVAAFLTNLTVVFVPLLVALTTFRKPATRLLLACGVAVVGIYLLTGVQNAGPGGGEWLIVGAALGFSIEIIILNLVMPKDDPYRVTVVIFLICGIGCGGVAMLSPGFWNINPHALLAPDFVWQIALLTVLCTLVAFGLMNAFQFKVDPTRAAIIYLFEPIVAAGFAAMTEDNATMTLRQLAGAALILLANVVAEIKLNARKDKL